jgi:upstream activation factor subunit UAF30
MSTATPAKTAARKVAKKEEAPAAAAPAPAAAAPVKAAKKAATKVPAPVAAAPAPVVVASTPVETAAAAAPAVPTTTLEDDLKAVTAALNTLKETASSLLGQVKKLDKRVRRAPKVEEGGEVKPRQPSIFERPTQVTDELCKFLGRPAGTQMSRSEVTKAVNSYVTEKGLKNKHDIKPDAALKKLLAIGDGETLTYFNLQKYLNRHYIKAEKPAVATA